MKRIIALFLLVVMVLTLCAGCYSEANMEQAASEAYEEGYKEGYDSGYDAGNDEGYDAGYEDGVSDGCINWENALLDNLDEDAFCKVYEAWYIENAIDNGRVIDDNVRQAAHSRALLTWLKGHESP